MPARRRDHEFGEPVAVKPVPAGPTNCRRCDTALEPLRRLGGLCAGCVKAVSSPPPPAVARIGSYMRVVRTFMRSRGRGRREQFVEVVCERPRDGGPCGNVRSLQLSEYKRAGLPRCCSRCRREEIDRHGFEAEYGR